MREAPPQSEARPTSTSRAITGRAAAYFELTKPGIAGYIMITAGVSAWVGAGGALDPLLGLHIVLGTGTATAGALAINQYVEREPDAVMRRTRGRPLPTGRLTAMSALAFGAILLMGGIAWLAIAVGALPAALTALSAAIYHGVYTPLKTRSYVATLAGAVPGALPMLIGWSATTGTVGPGGLALFAIGYLWQLPHVLALAWMLKEDYRAVGFKLIPPGGARSVGGLMTISAMLLLPASWLPTPLGLTGWWYAAGATLLGVGFLALAAHAARDLTEASARRVFLGTLAYQPLLLTFMLFDTAGG